MRGAGAGAGCVGWGLLVKETWDGRYGSKYMGTSPGHKVIEPIVQLLAMVDGSWNSQLLLRFSRHMLSICGAPGLYIYRVTDAREGTERQTTPRHHRKTTLVAGCGVLVTQAPFCGERHRHVITLLLGEDARENSAFRNY